MSSGWSQVTDSVTTCTSTVLRVCGLDSTESSPPPLSDVAARAVVSIVKAYPRATASVLFSLVWNAYKSLKNRLPANTVLEISLDRIDFNEVPVDPLVKGFYPTLMSTAELVATIEAAGRDTRVKAIVVRLGAGSCVPGAARIEEVRKALKAFHDETHRPVVAYCTSFGEAAFGLLDYWLASACSHIVMPPCGAVNVTSLFSSAMFIRGVLDKLGVTADLAQRRKYKLAANFFLNKEMTPEHRSQAEHLLGELNAILLHDLQARAPRDSAEPWEEVLRMGPFSNVAALEKCLVDRVMYYDELVEDLLPSLTGLPKADLHLRSLGQFRAHAKPARPVGVLARLGWSSSPAVAVMSLEGAIVQGSSTPYGNPKIGSDTVCAQLRALRDDLDAGVGLKALVLRIDSRGGSYIASDMMHRELKLVSERVPIFVSMGNVAASGGYYLAMAGHRIFASKGTVTGSIGVVNGKAVVRGALENIGATFDDVRPEGSDNAHYFSPFHEYGDQRDNLEAYTEHIYGHFKENVAADRSLTAEEVEERAQGRVYFGEAAHSLKLVTDMGGWTECLDAVAEHIGCSSRNELQMRRYPEPLTVLSLARAMAKKPRNREESDRCNPVMSVSIGTVLSVWYPAWSSALNAVLSVLPVNGALYTHGDLPML